MFGIYARIAAAIALALFLSGVYWKGHTSGAKSVQAEWDADVAQRTAQALEASETARKREQELSAKVRKVSDDYHAQKRATATVAAASALGLRNLEQQVTAARAASSSAASSSGDAADPRLDIIAECAAAYRLVDTKARELADQIRAMQALPGIVRVKP